MARADASMQGTPNQSDQRLPMSARVIAGLVLGLVLGVVGLPRIDLPLPSLPFMNRAVRRFMPGETLEDALAAALPLQAAGVTSMYTRLGENLEHEGCSSSRSSMVTPGWSAP